MVMDIRTSGKLRLKKSVVAFGGDNLFHTDFDGITATTVVRLPKDTLITNAYIIVREAFDAATTMTIKAGATNLLAAADAVTLGVKKPAAAIAVDTGTGADLTITASKVTTQGSLTLVVEGIEYNVDNGMNTQFDTQNPQ